MVTPARDFDSIQECNPSRVLATLPYKASGDDISLKVDATLDFRLSDVGIWKKRKR